MANSDIWKRGMILKKKDACTKLPASAAHPELVIERTVQKVRIRFEAATNTHTTERGKTNPVPAQPVRNTIG